MQAMKSAGRAKRPATWMLQEMRALFAQERPDKILHVCRDVQEGMVPGLPLSRELYEYALWATAKLVSPFRVLRLLDEMPRAGIPRDIEAWNHYLAACVPRGEIVPMKLALRLIAEETLELNRESYQHLIMAQVEAGQLDMARSTLLDMEHASFSPSWAILIRLIKGFLDARRPAEARNLLQTLRGHRFTGIDAKYWVDLARDFAKNDDPNACSVCYEHFMETCDNRNDSAKLLIDYGFFTVILEMCARKAQPSFAMRILRRMRKEDMTPNAHHLACLVKAYSLAKDYNSAFQVLRILRSNGAEVARLIQTSFIIDTVVGIDVALGLLMRMQDRDIECLNVLIRNCSLLGEDRLGLDIYAKCAELQLSPNLYTFNAALLSCRADKERALLILAEMRSLQLQPNAETYECMVEIECSSNDYESAFGYLESAKSDGLLTSRMYRVLVLRLIKAQDVRWSKVISEMSSQGFYVDKRLRQEVRLTVDNVY